MEKVTQKKGKKRGFRDKWGVIMGSLKKRLPWQQRACPFVIVHPRYKCRFTI